MGVGVHFFVPDRASLYYCTVLKKYCDIFLSADAGSRKIARHQISYLKEIGEGWFGKVRFYKSTFCKALQLFLMIIFFRLCKVKPQASCLVRKARKWLCKFSKTTRRMTNWLPSCSKSCHTSKQAAIFLILIQH